MKWKDNIKNIFQNYFVECYKWLDKKFEFSQVSGERLLEKFSREIIGLELCF